MAARVPQPDRAPRDGAPEPDEPAARAAILRLLDARAAGRTICPSEAARALGGDDGFRPLMPLVRDAARGLADEGAIEVTQRGEPVGIDAAHGPIRLRRRSGP